VIASRVPATSKFNFACCSSSKLGSKISIHSLFCTILTQATGPSKGAPLISSVSEAPVIPKNHKSLSFVAERAVAIICTSFINPFGNIGRIGLSMSLEVKIEDSEGRHSLFINLFPPIFPVA
jgi:hypothetical protein